MPSFTNIFVIPLNIRLRNQISAPLSAYFINYDNFPKPSFSKWHREWIYSGRKGMCRKHLDLNNDIPHWVSHSQLMEEATVMMSKWGTSSSLLSATRDYLEAYTKLQMTNEHLAYHWNVSRDEFPLVLLIEIAKVRQQKTFINMEKRILHYFKTVISSRLWKCEK